MGTRAPHYRRGVNAPEVDGSLLPASGIGVIGRWLVIAVGRHPVVRVDLRTLDEVSVIRDLPDHVESLDDIDVATLPDAPWCVRLVCGELDVALAIAEGLEGARRIARAAAPLTRGGASTAPVPHAPVRDHGTLVIVNELAVASGRTPPTRFALDRPRLSIGRSDDNAIEIDHPSISRQHAMITRDAASGRYTIRALAATNGVLVNGVEVVEAELADGDILDLGSVRLVLRDPSPQPDADSARFVIIGRDAITVRGDHLHVGDAAFRIAEVREYAEHGAMLPLPHGHFVQAAIALLVVAAAARDAA